MTSSTTDRFSGAPSGSDATPNASAIRDGLAIKAPVKAATTANITLSGEKTIDGVSVVSGDRVLVKDQTTTSENGIYECSTAAWSRTIDFDSDADIVEGTLIPVNRGTLYADTLWRVNTSAPSIGSALSITRASSDVSAYITSSQWNGLTGVLMPYGGSSAPSGWILCYGQAVSRTTYSALFDVVGTTYGSGDGSTTFNVPDMRGRAPFGKDNMGGSAANRVTSAGSGVDGTTLGATGGAQTHTLTEAELPAHTHTANAHGHTVNDSGHTHSTTLDYDNDLAGGGTRRGFSRASNSSNDGTEATTSSSVTTGITLQNTTVTLNNTGSGDAHNNMPPAFICNWIIKT